MIRRNRVHVIPTTPPPTSHKRASLTDVEEIPIILPSRPSKKKITVTDDGREPSTPISPQEPSTPIPPIQPGEAKRLCTTWIGTVIKIK